MTNIIKCTLKKSFSLTLMFLKWGSIIGIILAAIAGIGYLIWSVRDIIGSGWNTYASWTFSLLTQIGALLAGVPWYVWIIIAIPSSIIGYSYLWCWNRQNSHKIAEFIDWHFELISCVILGLIIGGVFEIPIFLSPGLLGSAFGFLPLLLGLLLGILAGIYMEIFG